MTRNTFNTSTQTSPQLDCQYGFNLCTSSKNYFPLPFLPFSYFPIGFDNFRTIPPFISTVPLMHQYTDPYLSTQYSFYNPVVDASLNSTDRYGNSSYTSQVPTHYQLGFDNFGPSCQYSLTPPSYDEFMAQAKRCVEPVPFFPIRHGPRYAYEFLDRTPNGNSPYRISTSSSGPAWPYDSYTFPSQCPFPTISTENTSSQMQSKFGSGLNDGLCSKLAQVMPGTNGDSTSIANHIPHAASNSSKDEPTHGSTNLAQLVHREPLERYHDTEGEKLSTHFTAGTTSGVQHLEVESGRNSSSRSCSADPSCTSSSNVRSSGHPVPVSHCTDYHNQHRPSQQNFTNNSNFPGVQTPVSISDCSTPLPFHCPLSQEGCSGSIMATGSSKTHSTGASATNGKACQHFTPQDPFCPHGICSEISQCCPRFGSRSDNFPDVTDNSLILAEINKLLDAGTRIPKGAELLAPLHVKPVSSISLQVVDEFAKHTSYDTEWQQVRRWVTDATLYSTIPRDKPDLHAISRISSQDLNLLLQHNIIAPADSDQVRSVGRYFCVYEPQKNRRRPILWPKSVNDVLSMNAESDTSFSLPSVSEQQSQCQHGNAAACFDLAASFFQVALIDVITYYFCFKTTDGSYFRFLRLPMGFTKACEVMQILLTVIANHRISTPALVYIDNVRFVGSFPSVTETLTQFRSNCSDANITLNSDSLNSIHSRGEFLSQCYDLHDKTCWLAPRAVNKLNAARSVLFSDELSCQSMLAAFGRVMWAVVVLRLPLFEYYYLFKWYRRRCQQLSLGKLSPIDPAHLWPSARHLLENLFHAILSNSPVPIPLESIIAHYILCTDASKRGYGAFLFSRNSGEYWSFGGEFTPEENCHPIVELEARALMLALQRFSPKLSSSTVDIYLDNTTVAHCLKKRRSNAFHLSKILAQVSPLLQSLKVYTIQYVPSGCNPADAPSRGMEIPHPVISQFLSTVHTPSPVSPNN